MNGIFRSPRRAGRACALAGALLWVIGCGGDGVGPTSEAAFPVDTTPAAPGDSTPSAPQDTASVPPNDSSLAPPDSATPTTPQDSSLLGSAAILDTRSGAPGIAFGTYGIETPYLNSVHTGTLRGGGLTADNVLSLLYDVRAKGARVVLKLCNGQDSYVQNSDGTFSFTKWKALVDRFKNVNLAPYIRDGTIIGHFLIDEPHRTAKWGGKVIPQATVEAMAKYSKAIWPDMTTLVRTAPSWLASAPVTYVYLDAGWAQYAANKGAVAQWIGTEVSAAKAEGLGLAVGLNVLDGGNGSSGIRGYTAGQYAMSASEIRTYGTALLGQSYACTFFMWMHSLSYYGRSDIASAMADLSAKAKSHAKTGCRQ